MAELLKNLYDETYIDLLSEGFFPKEFKEKIFNQMWENRELKQRMRHISTTMGEFLPKEYDKAVDLLKIKFSKMRPDFGLENMIFQDFVEVYGMNDFEKSMEALECFTKNCSSEFAIRRFILKYPQMTMKQMKKWAKSDDLHVRRLASEGCRPRLPWAIALPEFKSNPKEVLEILEILKDDESEYVRRSVANNLNDISKDNPELVKEISKRWIGKNVNRDKLLKHGCRTLLKSSEKDILHLFGYKKLVNVNISEFVITKKVDTSSTLEFSFLIESQHSLGRLRIEYALYFLRQNSKYSKKVFKISEGNYTQKSKKINKNYSFKPISTRNYYNGVHKVEIIINGEVLHESEFIYS
jgi:3-methyladenine DNA glycosylase AlkC